ncbi:uncharacterized protein LOC121695919 isoform X2 [Alosa sapidissima]|uniref:uncharacterized protein LOC121695919 isoform X2 n=2 Tax=Alosa sapidissima TaxID=34773 RepID=UPI001C08338A|nr:uncharacterized protein LOC121695919 isoform X2 [Alosa sapidissima]
MSQSHKCDISALLKKSISVQFQFIRLQCKRPELVSLQPMIKWDDISNEKIMDSNEDATAPEKRSITSNNASPSAVQPASTEPTAAEAHMGVHQHLLSTSRIQMQMMPFYEYIMDLSEEEWESFADAMNNPVTKAQFLTVCVTVAKHFTLSALNIIIMPSLARRLGEDPELLKAPDEGHGSANIIGTSPKNPSIIYIEDDLDVMEVNKGVLTKVIHKAGSRSSLRSCDEPPMSSHSSSGKRSSTSLQTTLVPQHGITKELILHNVQRSLTKLNEAGLTAASEEWIDTIVTEVTHTIASTFTETRPDLQNSSRRALSLQKTKSIELMKNISLKLKSYMAQQHKPSKTQASSLVEDNSILVSTTAEAMTTIIHEMETCLDGNEKNHPAKKLLTTMKRAVKILACQSVSSNHIPALDTDDLGELNVCEGEKLGQNSGQCSSIALERLSSDQFCTKAKKAISDVLTEKVKAVHSTSSTGPCFSSGYVLESNINMEDEDLFSSHSPHSVYSVGSMIVDAFVEEITSIVESTECARESFLNEETASETPSGEPSVVPDAPKNQTVEAAKGLYDKVQLKLKEFFKNPLILWRKGMSTPDIETIEAMQVMDVFSAQHSGVQPTSTCSEQLLPRTRPLLRKVHSDGTHSVALGEFYLTQTQLDECTRDALKGVLTTLLSKEAEEPCVPSSAPADTFVEKVIFQLDDLISSSSSMTLESSSDHSSKYSFENVTRTYDSTGRESSSLACLQKLSCEVFQTNALMAVSEAVLKTVRSHNSKGTLDQPYLPERVQVSSFFFLPVETETSDTDTDTPNVDVESAASIMVNQILTDLQGCVESMHSMKVECDKPHKENFFTKASKLYHNLLNKMEDFFTQISFKGIGLVKQLVKEPTKEQNCNSEFEHPTSEERNIQPLVDLKDATKEVLSRVLTLYKDEMVGENAECDTSHAVSTEDKNIIMQLEAYFAPPESPIQRLGNEDYTDETVPSHTKLSQKLSEDEFQSKATKLVSDVLLLTIRKSTDSLDSHKVAGAFISKADPQMEVQNAASDLVTEVTNVVQKLLDSTDTPDIPASPCSYMKKCIDKDIEPSEIISQTTEDADVKIWSKTCKTFQSFRRKLKNVFAKYHLAHSKVEDKDKEAISKVLGFILEELAQSVDLDYSEEQITDNVEEEDDQLMKEPQKSNSYSSTASKSKLSKLRSEVLSGAVLSLSETPAEAPPLRHVYSDMNDMDENESSPINRDSIINIVNTISAELVQNDSLSPAQDLTSVGERLERLLCNDRLSSLSHNLCNLIHHLYIKDQKGMMATKSVSDSLLLNLGQSGKFPKNDIVRQFVQIYAEETVKHFFLPCFNIPSPWKMDVGGVFQHASSSASCLSFLHSLSEIVPQSASRSPSQILQSTLQDLPTVMARNVINLLAPTLQTTGELEAQTDQQPLPDNMCLFSRPSSGDPTQISATKDIGMGFSYSSLNPVDSTSEDYTNLVSILVIRLLSKLKDQESLADDMLDISRVLIDRIITEIDAALGIAKSKACPHDVRIRKVFKTIYNDLLHEFGGKEILLKAMMSEDPCFETCLVTSLTREFMQTTDMPNPKEEKTKKWTLGFLPKISKIKTFLGLKKSKSGNNGEAQSTNMDQNLDPISAHAVPTVLCAGCLPCVAPVASSGTTTSASPEKKPRRGFFSRIISSLSRKSPKICPETLH